jgi:hypothetical protein
MVVKNPKEFTENILERAREFSKGGRYESMDGITPSKSTPEEIKNLA